MGISRDDIAYNKETGQYAVYANDDWRILDPEDVAKDENGNIAIYDHGREDWSVIKMEDEGFTGTDVGRAFRGFMSGMTIGLSRAAEAGVRGVADVVSDESKGIGDLWDSIKEESHNISKAQKEFSEEYPKTAFATELAGGLTGGLAAAPRLLAKQATAKSLGTATSKVLPVLGPAQTVPGAIATGTAAGGIYGASTSDWSDAPETFSNTIHGGIGGGVLSPIGLIAGNKIGRALSKGTEETPNYLRARPKTVPEAERVAAAKRLRAQGIEVPAYSVTGSSKAKSIENNAASFRGSREILRRHLLEGQEQLRKVFNRKVGIPEDVAATPAVIAQRRKELYGALENASGKISGGQELRDTMYDAIGDYGRFSSYRPGIDEALEAGKINNVLAQYENMLSSRNWSLTPKEYIELHQALTRQRMDLMQDGMTRKEAEVFDKILNKLDDLGDRYNGPGMKEFKQARELYRAESVLGVGKGKTVDPVTGQLNVQSLVDSVRANDANGYVRQGNTSEFYNTLRDYASMTDMLNPDVKDLGREVSTSIYSTLLRPLFDTIQRRRVTPYLYDPKWMEYSAGKDIGRLMMVPGLLQESQPDSNLLGILKEEYLNAGDGQY